LCTEPNTRALVVPLRSSSSTKNSAASSAWSLSAKAASAGKVWRSSQSSSCSPWAAMMSTCGKWMWVSTKPGTISLPVRSSIGVSPSSSRQLGVVAASDHAAVLDQQ
jgi:hypothetical protein